MCQTRSAQKRKVLVVPNEDGAGPSALLSHVVKALLRRAGGQVGITVWNRSRETLNRHLYSDLPAVTVDPVWNVVQLAKDRETGTVSVPATLSLMQDYRTARDRYPGPGVAGEGTFDLVLDCGVPPAVRWARRSGFPSVSLFDHCWSRTLTMIGEAAGTNASEDSSWEPSWGDLVAALEEDEKMTERLFVFPPFLTPATFRSGWKRLGVTPRDLGAVLGGRSRRSGGRGGACLTLREPGPVVLVQAGDTPVWDAALLHMVDVFLRDQAVLEERAVNVAVFVPYRLLGEEPVKRLDREQPPRVRRIPYVKGGTIQDILPAVDLLVTRAGGGTVNDAVACRVPFVCVREQTQPQVEAILEACLQCGFTRELDSAAFLADPAGAVLRELCREKENRAMADRMGEVPVGGEDVVAAEILRLLNLPPDP